MTDIWYVCYGSNMDEDRFRKYLSPASASSLSHTWVECPYSRYFAGTSKTWGGAVAFLSLQRRDDVRERVKGYLIRPSHLSQIASKENGASSDVITGREVLKVGEWTALPAERSEDGFHGKYNALLRLADIDGIPAFTLTTARRLQLGRPTEAYLRLIEEALGGTPVDWLETSQAADNSEFITSEWEIRFPWSSDCRSDRNTGFDAIRLPLTYAPAIRFPALLGALETESARAPTWLIFSEEVGHSPLVDASLADAVGLADDADSAVVHLDVARPVQRRRLSAVASDIPPNDVLQVHPVDAARFGKWTLVISPTLAAPFRVVARPHVPEGSVRIGYASRRLLGLREEDETWIQQLPPPRRRRRNVLRGLGEYFVGAPVLALRSTEGLVGDDGAMIVRVDSTALDLLGVASGDRVVVSWGWRSIDATVLLQTASTIETMHDQLSERTGAMARQSVGDIEQRLRIPEHLRVWVSSRIRYRLQIPPDTIVRLRRSVTHTMFKHAFALSLPAAGFLLAALALTHVPAFVLIALAIGVLLATFATIRRRERSSRNVDERRSGYR